METKRVGFAEPRIEGDGEAGLGSPVRGATTGEEEAVVVGGGKANPRPLRRRGVNVKRKAALRRKHLPPRDGEKRPPPARSSAPVAGDYREEDAIAVHRRVWERRWAGNFGSFDDETGIGPMCYTSAPPTPEYLFREQAVQIFSIRVRAPTDGLKWPLHVHGYVATRDSMDRNRNYLFRRARDNCQTLTQNDPFLLLTGPSRAVVFLDPITFEVQLKVKGKGESEDEMLAFAVFYYGDGNACARKLSMSIPHNRCTLEYEVALRPRSVEATISVKIVEGSWPENHRGQVVALTSGVDGEVVLLRSGDRELPVGSDGAIELSRRVVSVDLREKLVVAVDASLSGFLARGTAEFKPENYGTSHGVCDLGSCKIQVAVAWSLFVIVLGR
ncbi:hypothetical protein CFC21_026488 [Triticum aestivum]|uniref:DUF6598 domain-containing protein n=2 Tax=Triticum aestivum TaxID=4565 RepID=A0A9R1JCB9_WHEAT|nr:hypothetical protein CFC21_021755 [Triticum aestivum]KAF7012280.1 hypothetical protein CFC21_026488 [Triticum aestivum]